MNPIVDRLLAKLAKHGLTDREIPWLLRDVLNILNKEHVFNVIHVNRELSNLGWEQDLLDGTTLELVLHLIETGRNPVYPGAGRPTIVFASFW